jgi:DNA ligase 1
MISLAQLVDVSQRVGANAARTSKIRALAELLRTLTADEIAIGVHYLSGETPQGRSGIGYALLQRAAAGEASAESSLMLMEVDRALSDLATLRGAGSAAQRAVALGNLFQRATADERRFLIALLAGELRQGALAGLMAEAIAAAAELRPEQVRRAAMYAKNLGAVAAAALGGGAAALDQFQFELFSPVAPMLAQTAADVAEALQTLPGELAFEWKMDGARIQVHKGGNDVRIFTRTLNDVTAALPEIVDAVRGFAAESVVLDGEAIALDRNGRPLPFQITMRRFGRRLKVEQMRQELPMSAFFFDCLYLDGRSFADSSTAERAAALSQAVPVGLRFPRLVTASPPAAQSFYEAALAAGHEGVMAKALEAPYQAGNRDARWLKIKRAHTLDLVVLAAEWGHGRRTGKLSNLHLGALDPATGEYVMLGKTFKGLTDAMLAWQTDAFLERETHRDRGTVYVRPELVAEIAFSDLQASPRYPGGLALRLARVKRYREDKPAAEADTMEAVRRLYDAQSGTS